MLRHLLRKLKTTENKIQEIQAYYCGEDSEESPCSDVRGATLHNEEYTTGNSQVLKIVSKPISTIVMTQVSTPLSSQVIPTIQPPTPTEHEIFEIVVKNPILNLLQHHPATTIPIPTSSIPISTTQPNSTPTFNDFTIPTFERISISTPPKTFVKYSTSSHIH